jgi:hypothetical protein
MHNIDRQTTKRLNFFPSTEMLLLGIFATLVFQCFRIDSHRWLPAMWMECLFFLAAPVVALVLLSPRLPVDETIRNNRRLITWLQGGAVLTFAGVLISQSFAKNFGLGDANEIVVLMTVLYVGWYLVVFSSFGGFSRAAFVLLAALVLFVCFMTTRIDAFVFASLFAVTALWWLLDSYWGRINEKLLDGKSRMLPLNGLAIGGTVVILALAGLITSQVAPNFSSSKVNGFSFFSGGEDGYDDPFARSGIGDGDMLTGGPNATTTGAVESEQFIEDHKQSLYDITSDKFEGPVKIKKRQNRAIALDAVAKHMHNVIQSEQAGKSFRTVRDSGKRKELELENRITDALFFVEGSVPARFTVDCFQHFDGWDWTKRELSRQDFPVPTITIRNQWSKPWYKIDRVMRSFLTSRRAHRLKVMRLETNALLAPSLLHQWHIDRVDKKDMFSWDRQGIVRMDGDSIPTHTMIDMVSNVPNYHVLRSTNNFQLNDQSNSTWAFINRILGTETATGSGDSSWIVQDEDSPCLQIAESESKARIENLATELTQNQKVGWKQIESIVNHFRQNFEYDPSLVATVDHTDSISAFLDNQGGPSYLFATTATQVLRAAGYRTRLASGFVVEDDDYDRIAQQSVVTSDNAHMWPEVCVDGWHWIPVEPTPTYSIPFSHQTWWQWTKAQLGVCIYWAWSNPVTTLGSIFLLITLYRSRKELIACACWFLWATAVLLIPRNRLKLTRQLIDVRFWAAGLPRPRFASAKEWFSQVDQSISNQFFQFWWADNFCSQPDARVAPHEVMTACRQLVEELPFSRIKSFAQTSPPDAQA